MFADQQGTAVDHQWSADHRLGTAALQCILLPVLKTSTVFIITCPQDLYSVYYYLSSRPLQCILLLVLKTSWGREWIISVGDYVDNSFTALGSSDPREVRLELLLGFFVFHF